MEEEAGLIQDYTPAHKRWLRTLLTRTTPRWMGPSFAATLVFALAALIVIIVLAVLVGEKSSSTTEILDTITCGTDVEELSDAFMAQLHRETRQKVINALFADYINATSNGFIYLPGGSIDNRYSTDVELPFRQESNFLYLTGVVDIPDSSILINLATQESILFVPLRGSSYALWNGVPATLAQIKQKYGTDGVFYSTDFNSVVINMTKLMPNESAVVVYTRSGVTFPSNQTVTIDTRKLSRALSDARVIKTDSEIKMMRVAITVSADAHVSLMQSVNHELYEYSLASRFIAYGFACSLQFQAYNPIVGAGYHSAILHYNANSDPLTWKQNASVSNGHDNLVLVDAGAEYYGYGADITRTYPISGKFTQHQRNIYSIVLDVQSQLIAMVKPNLLWRDISNNAFYLSCLGLQNINLIAPSFNCTLGDTTVVSTFLPHGVGHNLGLDVHDPGQLSVLLPGMIVTIEPGIYFNEVIFARAFKNPVVAPFLVQPEIQKYLTEGFGGVRIEDDILVTSDGAENLSINAPRTIADIEKLMAGR